MIQTFAVRFLVIATILAAGTAVRAQTALSPPAVTYEVQINGESFLVEANRAAKLESKEKPGVTYSVAVRVAPTQRVRLNTIQFEYDLPAKLVDDGDRNGRSVRLTHELGFSVLLGDLGKPLEPKAQETTLKMLVESVTTALRDEKATKIEVADPRQRTFAGSSARGMTVHYRDAKGIAHVYLVYVLSGPTFAATCVVEYLDNDAEDVLPLIKKTLDSVRAVPLRR